MTETGIFKHTYDNGVVLLAEPVAGVQSLSMNVLVPGGVSYEPASQSGIAGLLSDMICRGAGELDAKAHSDALDQLGVQRSTSAQSVHLRLGATMLSSKLPAAMPLLMSMIRQPMLTEASLEPARDLALQDLAALEDEPQQKVFVELRRRHFPEPFGRSSLGNADDLQSITQRHVRDCWQSRFVARGTIIGAAGHFDWQQLKDLIGEQLEGFAGRCEEPEPAAAAERGYLHLPADTNQLHIGLAYDAVPETDADSILQQAAAAVLSGGMSGRLFTEVRERHGLCYAVYAAYAASKHLGAVLSYAGTTSPRAQKTLDILAKELRRLSEGVTEDEFQRAIVGMKSRLVMQGESTAARAAAVAMDQYTFGRPRSLEELTEQVDSITLGSLNSFLADNPPGAMTVTTLGANELAAEL